MSADTMVADDAVASALLCALRVHIAVLIGGGVEPGTAAASLLAAAIECRIAAYGGGETAEWLAEARRRVAALAQEPGQGAH